MYMQKALCSHYEYSLRAFKVKILCVACRLRDSQNMVRDKTTPCMAYMNITFSIYDNYTTLYNDTFYMFP